MADRARDFYLAMADELDHNRQCLLDDRSLTHPLADRARAALETAPATDPAHDAKATPQFDPDGSCPYRISPL